MYEKKSYMKTNKYEKKVGMKTNLYENAGPGDGSVV